MDAYTESGLYAGQYSVVQAPSQEVQQHLALIVRGLYRCYLQRDLPHPSQFAIARKYDQQEVELEIQIFRQTPEMGKAHVRVGNGDSFTTFYAHYPPHPETSVWYLNFFDRALWYVATNIGKGLIL